VDGGWEGICEPLGVVSGGTVSRFGIHCCRNEMCGHLRRAGLVYRADGPTSIGEGV
jgi:hypothetical protein